jgi:sigma-E factor negative regulatory protein RseB
MLHRPLLALTMVGALSAFLPTASAQSQTSGQMEPREVRSWLMRIHEAASRRNFQGTFIVSAGGAVSSARIAHFCEGSNQFERIDSLDGQTRHVFRHNDLVHTLWPQARVALVEQRQLLNSFPALFQGGEDRIAEHYDVRPQGTERVAGHDASVLLLKPRDPYRFGYRLWSEKASGLLLRADVLGERGEILETSASPTSRSACGRSPSRCCSRCASSTATAWSSPASRRPGSKPRVGRFASPCPGSAR